MANGTGAYVALGDSISIDDYSGGPGTGGASLLFRNRDDDFPLWRGRDLSTLSPGTTFVPLATDGATTATLLEVQLPQLAARGVRPSVVTITVGGNDLLQAYGSTGAARTTVRAVRADVALALTRLQPLLGPAAQVVVGTVYDPSDGTGDAARLGLPPWPDAVAVIAELNDALREVTAEHGHAVAEVAKVFAGHGLLAGDAGSPQARPADRDLWFCHVIEPNAWGASGVREAFWNGLRT